MEEFEKFINVNNRLARCGLIAISLIILQGWISSGVHDPSSFISLIAFAVSLPMLVFDLLFLQMSVGHYNLKKIQLPSLICRVVGISVACVGVAAAIWHVSWIAGVLFLVSGLLSFIIYCVIFRPTNILLKNEHPKLSKQNLTI